MTQTNYFLIVPHNCISDNPTPVICQDIEGFARDWLPGKNKAMSIEAIQRCLEYKAPYKRHSNATNQKVGDFAFYPVIEPIEEMPLPKTSNTEDARTLGQYLKMLSPEQVTQALLIVEQQGIGTSTGIENAIRYAQFCHPSLSLRRSGIN